MQQAPRILVGAPASGGGKTTFTCGLLAALARRGFSLSACKCGPDYIDPMFHREVIGARVHNLDLFFADGAFCRDLIARDAAAGATMCVIEGVMGYYDGVAVSDQASAWHVAHETSTPAVLVVDGRGRAVSAAAEVAGFARFRDPSHVAGVVLNRVSPALCDRLAPVIERESGVRVLGCVPVLEDAGLKSRHLGLVTAAEVEDLRAKLAAIADVLEECVDVDGLIGLAQSAPALNREAAPRDDGGDVPAVPGDGAGVTLAVARDDAFCFYYDDTLRALEAAGARLAWFSPLADGALPQGAAGLYLGGGYPELHARELSGNGPMLAAVREAIASGMPTVAECGGFMYLHEQLEGDDGRDWPLVGAIPGRSFRTRKLGRFGYVTLTARADSLLAPKGGALAAHEFHYWDSESCGDAFRAQKPQSARGWDCAHATPTLFAGYPHLHLASRPDVIARWVGACRAYAAKGGAA